MPLPPARFFGGQYLNGGIALPIVLADAGSATLPLRDACSGFNTLNLLVTITNIVAGNTFKVILETIDPETGAAIPSALGSVTMISQTTNNSFAASLYLPAYYTGLTGLILPFYVNDLKLTNTGGNAGNMNVTALKVWLSNA